MYRKEAEDQQRKLDKFIADKAEDWDINNGVRVIADVIISVHRLNCYRLV